MNSLVAGRQHIQELMSAVEVMEKLLEDKKREADLLELLHFAAKGGSTMIVSELLKRGAEVNATDAMDETPLHFAARAGHVEICEALLAKGAAKDPLNVQDFTPLVVAGRHDQAATVNLLMEKGAGVAGMRGAVPLSAGSAERATPSSASFWP